MQELEVVIGLEIHVQLNTKTKMFCSCVNSDETVAPNTNICPICTGHPGTLPYPNKEAVKKAILAGLALQAHINETCKFDRKHYFYPDLPKGYQISQYDVPIVGHGVVTIVNTEGEERNIRIERAHLEEDAAKNTHTSIGTLVDYNRAGTPLLEIVTFPDFKTPDEAKIFLQELRLLMRTIGVSNADMEKGQMRCDVNISMRPKGSTEFFPKTEIKNVNSFRSVERALKYEIERQSALWHTNTPPNVTTTRGFDDETGKTELQRTKEAAKDYRYFPEPDIPPLFVADMVLEGKKELPELPHAYRERLRVQYQFKPSDIAIFVENREIGNFAENVMSELDGMLGTAFEGTLDDIKTKHGETIGKQVGGWITSKMLGALSAKKWNFADSKMDAENFAELMMLVMGRKVNSTTASRLLEKMIETGGDPDSLLEDLGISTESTDSNTLETIINKVLEENPDAVEKYKAGKTNLIEFLVGKTMKELKGSGDPAEIRENIMGKIE